MSFGNPWILALLPLLAAVALWRAPQGNASVPWPAIRRVSIVGRRLRPGLPAQQRPRLITLLAIALALVATAQPRWGEGSQELFVNTREVMIALDLSRSMLTEDVAPSRLEQARALTVQLLDQLKGESVGLVVFAGTAFVQVPLSPDYQIVREFLPILDTEYLPQGGSDYTGMLQAALDGFGEEDDRDRYLFVLSDGESSTEGWQARLDELSDRGVHVISIGFGTDDGGFIPDQEGGYLQNAEGDTVHSRLMPATLQALAKRTNGRYVNAASLSDAEAVRDLLAETVERGRKGRSGQKADGLRQERFQWLLLPAILLGLVGLYREFEQRPRPRLIRRRSEPPRSGAGALAGGIALSLLLAPAARAHFDSDAGFDVREMFDSNPVKRLRAITEHLAEYDYDAYDLRLMVEETIKYGLDAQRTQTDIAEGVIRDAIEATHQGEQLDRTIADWSYYRSQLQNLLAPPASEQSAEAESKSKKELMDEEDNPPTVTGQSSAQAASDSFGEGSSARTDAAMGDLTPDERVTPSPRKRTSPPPPKRGQLATIGGSGGGDHGGDAILAINRKRLAEVSKRDSPGRLHQLLVESEQQQDSNEFDW